MPLMVFMGMPSEGRRTRTATVRRIESAAKRGWTQERIRQSIQNKGKAKGKDKGKGKDENEVATRGGGAQPTTEEQTPAAQGDDRRNNSAWDSNADSWWTSGGWERTRGREGWNSWEQPWWNRGGADWRSTGRWSEFW